MKFLVLAQYGSQFLLVFLFRPIFCFCFMTSSEVRFNTIVARLGWVFSFFCFIDSFFIYVRIKLWTPNFFHLKRVIELCIVVNWKRSEGFLLSWTPDLGLSLVINCEQSSLFLSILSLGQLLNEKFNLIEFILHNFFAFPLTYLFNWIKLPKFLSF